MRRARPSHPRVAHARAQQPGPDADEGTWAAYLDGVAEAFRARTGVAARCHLLPPGENDAEMWETMALLARLDIAPGRVSIDITHAMRHQPLFLFATLLYLDAVRPGVEVGDVFYGNLFAAARDRKPILRLGALVDVMAWTDAAQKFHAYGDAGPLAALLSGTGTPEGTALAQAAERFSLVLMGNAAHKLHDTARALLGALDAFPEGQNAPFDLVRTAIAALPRDLCVDGQPPWEAMLRVARFHARSRRPTLALIAAWEATMACTSDLLGTPITHENTSARSALVASVFPTAAVVRADRNASAHARTNQDQDKLLRDLDTLLGTLPATLDALDAELRAPDAAARVADAYRAHEEEKAEKEEIKKAKKRAAHEHRVALEMENKRLREELKKMR